MTDPNIGWADLGVRPDVTGFDRDLERKLGPQMTSVGRSSAARFSEGFKRAAVLGAAGAGALALKLGKDSIDQASSLNESLNAVNVTYKDQATAVKALGEAAADTLGLSNTEFNGLAVQFAGFAETIGRDGAGTVATLKELTTRGADFASVMDLDVNEALSKFQSGLAGETEPLRQYNVDLSAARVETFALAKGIQEQGTAFTEAEKVQSRYALLMKSTKDTQGDFTRTSGDLANSQRRLGANWDNLQAKLGTELLPLTERFVNFLVDDGLPKVEKFGDWFTQTGAPAIKDFADEVEPAVGAVKDLVGFLADLPSEAKVAGLVALAGGIGAAKLRGGGGALGAAGSALGLAKPVPVFVTNQGVGSPTGTSPSGRAGSAAATVMTAGGAFLGLETLRQSLQSDGGPLDDSVKRAVARNIGLGSYLAFNLDDLRGKGADYGSTFGEAFKLGMIKGIPEARTAVQSLLRQYDKTPTRKRTTFEIFGFDLSLDQARRLGRELDYAARDREARIRITKEYADQGYETRGGLQRGGGTVSTNTGRALGGYQ